MKTVALSLLTFCCIVLALFATGCASSNLGREAQNSDGFFDFAWAVVGHPRKDVVPVKRFSGRAGEIITAHAEADRKGGTYVSGVLRNGFGYSDVYDAHVDVRVISGDRRIVAALATDFIPRPIPSDYHGIPGRASFSVRLPFVPTAGSTVQVLFHQTDRQECGLARLTAKN